MKKMFFKAFALGAIMTSGFSIARGLPAYLPKINPVEFNPPKGTRRELSNGMVVYLLKDATLPVIHMSALVKTGKIYDSAGKAGLGELATGLLRDGGTRSYQSDEIDKTLEFLGAEVETSIGAEEARVTLFTLKKDLDKTLAIFSSVLMEPAFEDDKTALKKAEIIEVIRRRNDKASREAQREALRMFYGSEHPYGRRTEAAIVEAFTKDELKAYHANYFKPNNIILTVAGDFADDAAIIKELENRFSTWKKGDVVFSAIAPVKTPSERSAYLINKDVAQASIAILQRGIKRHDPAFYSLTVANEILGGGLSSRLAAEVRSRRGLAYSVYSYFAPRPDYGFFNASCDTKPETYSQALSEMLKQIDLMKKKIVPAYEVQRAKDSIVNSFVFRFTTPFDLINERATYEHLGYKPDYLDTYVAKISAVTPADVLKVSSEILAPEKALIFIVGDSNKFDKPLSAFGKVTELKED